jgi:hypothetical protein
MKHEYWPRFEPGTSRIWSRNTVEDWTRSVDPRLCVQRQWDDRTHVPWTGNSSYIASVQNCAVLMQGSSRMRTAFPLPLLWYYSAAGQLTRYEGWRYSMDDDISSFLLWWQEELRCCWPSRILAHGVQLIGCCVHVASWYTGKSILKVSFH